MDEFFGIIKSECDDSHEELTQVCVTCNVEKSYSEFRRNNLKRNDLTPRPDCIKCEGKNRKVMVEIIKRGDVPPKPDACELCGSKEKLFLDHCHVNEEFRGWFCNRCNRAIAAFEDTAEGLMRAAIILQQKEREMHKRIKARSSKTLEFIFEEAQNG